ncbi:hypothetical protein ACFWHL_16280 [Streptomyces massasporeus]
MTAHWPLLAAAFGSALAAWPCITWHDRTVRARRAARRKNHP